MKDREKNRGKVTRTTDNKEESERGIKKGVRKAEEGKRMEVSRRVKGHKMDRGRERRETEGE